MELRKMIPEYAPAITRLYIKNRENLRSIEPIRPEEFYTVFFQKRLMEPNFTEQLYEFGIFEEKELIGKIKLSNLVRGACQWAVLGYWLDEDQRNKGYATQAVRGILRFAFQELGLHRIQASVLPSNLPSIRVLEKCGFERIGLARQYLKINGVWEDHYLYQIVREEQKE